MFCADRSRLSTYTVAILLAAASSGCLSSTCTCYSIEGEPPRFGSNRVAWTLSACGDPQCEAGVSALSHQQWQAALDAFESLLDRDPQHAHALAGAAYALEMLGRREEAAARYGQAYDKTRDPAYLRARQSTQAADRADDSTRS